MSIYTPRIEGIFALVDSKKVTDHKKAVTKLLELYDIDAALKEITENSKDPDNHRITWNYVFDIVHQLVLIEGERLNKLSGANQLDKSRIQTLFTSTAKYGRDYFKSKDVVCAVVQILSERSFVEYYDMYLGILRKYILENTPQRITVAPQYWPELLKICTKVYKNSPKYLNHCMVLEIIELIVHHGCSQSRLLFETKQLLPFLLNILENHPSQNVMTAVFKLMHTVCLQIASESRFAICKFTESLPLSILDFNGPDEKYKFFLLSVQTHHPSGAALAEDGAYVWDSDRWKANLNYLYSMILKNLKSEILSESFIQLACEVFKQILKNPIPQVEATQFSDSLYMQPTKKRRISGESLTLTDMIAKRDPERAWPMIQILAELFQKYPECLKVMEFVSFLEAVIELMTQACKNEKIMESLCKLVAALVETENKCFEQKNADIKIYWDKIWDMILRHLSISQNEGLNEGHKLAQILIIHQNVSNPNALLRLYLTKTIKWSVSSLRTLLVFCEHIVLPTSLADFDINQSTMSNVSLKMHLAQWALRIPWRLMSTHLPLDVVSKTLIGFTLKSWYKERTQTTESGRNLFNTYDSTGSITLLEIEKCHLSLEMKSDLLAGARKESTKNQSEKKSTDHPYEEADLEFLIKCILDVLTLENASKDLSSFIVKTALVAKIATDLAKLNMISGKLEDFCFKIETALEKIYKSIAEIDWHKSRQSLGDVMKSLSMLYQTSFDERIVRIILISTTLPYLRCMFALSKPLNASENDEFPNSIRASERKAECRMNILKALASFCCLTTGEPLSDMQEKITQILLRVESYDFSSEAEVRNVITLLDIFANIDKRCISQDVMVHIIEFLSEISFDLHKDERAVRCILNLIPRFLKLTTHEESVYNLWQICRIFYKILNEGSCGQLAHLALVQCFGEIFRQDHPVDLWSEVQFPASQGSNISKISLAAILLSCAKSPFYLVRLETCKLLHLLFSSKILDHASKLKFFNKLHEAVGDSFVVDRELADDEKTDERASRVTSATNILATVIFSNGVLRSSALSALLQMKMEKDIDTNVILKVLQAIGKHESPVSIVEQNLGFLLRRWCRLHPSFVDFPWALLGCPDLETFYQRYIEDVFSTIFCQRGPSEAIDLCQRSGFDLAETFERCLPHILPEILLNNEDILWQLIENKGDFRVMKAFMPMLNDNLEAVVIHILQKLHDPPHFSEMFDVKITLPESNPPHYDSEKIDECLSRLEKIMLASRKSLISYLITDKPNIFQKVLLGLTCNIYEHTVIEYKWKAFHQYAFFCLSVSRELSQMYCDSMATYIVRDVILTLLNLLESNDIIITKLVCRYLVIFCNNILPARKRQVGEVLDRCVKCLSPFVEAKHALNFLLNDQKELLLEYIQKLDTLPNIFTNEAMDVSMADGECIDLEKEMEKFLKAGDDKSCNVRSLFKLKYHLGANKTQLRSMYERLEELQGFAEDCASSLLHQLIYRLVKLSESSDSETALGATKCLGVLGPANLYTMILHPEETRFKLVFDCAEMLTHEVAIMLSEFVFSSDINLRKASSKVLYEVLASPWGQKLTDEKYLKKIENLDENDLRFRLEYVLPFVTKVKASSKMTRIDGKKLDKCFDPENPLWTTKSDGAYKDWIVDITSSMANCSVHFEMLLPVFQLSVRLCEATFPKIVSYISQQHTDRICQCIDQFFSYHFECESTEEKKVQCSHDTVRRMLDLVNYLRIQMYDGVRLDLNYLPIAKAAQFCSAYFTSVLYAELWCRSILVNPRDFDSVPVIDQIYEAEPNLGKKVQSILREAYAKIGNPDTIYGCGSSHLQDRASRIQYYEDLKNWNKAILARDVDLSTGSTSLKGMSRDLTESSLHFLASRFLSMANTQSESLKELQYQCFWRLSDWNHVRDRDGRSLEENISFESHHYDALKAFHHNDNTSLRNSLEQAHFSIIKDLRNISLESCKVIYPHLTQLQMLREIEELSSAKPEDYETLLNEWRIKQLAHNNDFQYIEPILSQRAILFQIRDTIKNNPVIKNALIDVYLETAQRAEQQGYLQVAERALTILEKQSELSEATKDQLRYHEANLAWLRNDQYIGKLFLRNLIHKKSIDPSLLAQTLRVYGDRIAESKSENPQVIIEKYYLASINVFSKIARRTVVDTKHLHESQASLARFAHEQYQQVKDYMRSPQLESLRECVDHTSRVVENKNNAESKDNDIKRAVTLSKRQNSNDCAELVNIEREMNMYLILAVEQYLKTLHMSDEHDLLIFRLVSLWLDNMHHEETNQLLDKYLPEIDSYKFIPLVPQLAPHMSDVQDGFTKKIFHILEKCARQHPYHTLPVLLALKNLHNDNKYSKKRTQSEPRVLGAQQLIQRLSNSTISPIIREMDRLSDALVMLAYLEAEKKPGDKCKIPRSQEILSIKNLENATVPTLTIDVKKNGNYSRTVGIRKYLDQYANVGGINAPKKITCVGTDGICRSQLVKGKDDLRQDAVMQQVFTVMNSLLKTSKEAKQRKLYIRTYKVVPLTQRSGVLEWCENTLPMNAILVGSNTNKGMHRKYYPNDYTAAQCRTKLGEAAKSTADKKHKVFLEICDRFHPAFHHFFTDNYLSPETWFERRLAYTRSVATTSIIGYILGLGDRHVSNILIDQTTAEVIHIDFGIAFEQGKVLPTPETVPFRLTRDVEVAMGVSGVEGTMRRCCEETMTVLREQKEIIVTLLQVLLYDPLYSWAITPAKAATLQSDHSSHSTDSSPGVVETNKLAERALLRVQQKLQGIEEGVASSVAGQVERLIQQARDPANLCRLFVGWQPYM